MNEQETDSLTDSQKARIKNLDAIIMSSALIGQILGLIYAARTGGGFLRYVGYFILGGLILGLPAMLIMVPFKNKIINESAQST